MSQLDTAIHDDRWTISYLTVVRLQPLVEAFDDDSSTFVTIAEANVFTDACPREWRYVLDRFLPETFDI